MFKKIGEKMKKVLVISGHPDLENSTANKAIISHHQLTFLAQKVLSE